MQNFNLHAFQEQSIEAYLNGKDVFCAAPTGSGKSIVYELAPFVFDMKNCKGEIDTKDLQAVVVIVQPLKALMEDNVTRLTSRGLKAAYVGDPDVAEGVRNGNYNFIFGSPESFTGQFQDIFLSAKVAEQIRLLVIDESHCIKKW
jgi:ATP-dependent DNA helicase RecQ